jgi:hypothetical protein
MDLFRRKQKYIYWIVAIIIIPSFVLVWGTDGLGTTQTQGDFIVGTANGRNIGYAEFDAFQRRINGALGGYPLTLTGQPDAGTRTGELSKMLFVYSLLEDAKKAGISASDLQVATYINNSHPGIMPAINKADPASRDRAINDFCRSMNLTPADLAQGIRDWQTIGNYVDAGSRLAAVSDESVYAVYSLNKADVVVKRVRIVENDALRELAKAEIMAKPEDELQTEARNHAAGRANDPRYRSPAKWRFSWVLVPFVPEDSIPQPTDAEIAASYEADRAGHYAGQTLEQAREHIIAEHFITPEVERQTTRNMTVDVDPQLRAQAELPAEELAKLTQLAKYGVVAGETGAAALPSRDVVAGLPEGIEMDFAAALESIDTSSAEMRDSIVNELKAGYNLTDRPYRSEKGLFRIRLLDYEPSTPISLDGEDGKMNTELYELALADMVGERATVMAQEQAEATEAQVRELMLARENGEAAPDADFATNFDAMPTDTISYLNIADNNYALGTLPIGDILGPHPYFDPSGERGQELIVMVGRHVPSRETFAAETQETKDDFRTIALNNYRGGYGMTFNEAGPAIVLTPGAGLWSGLMDKYLKGEIAANPELTQTGAEG